MGINTAYNNKVNLVKAAMTKQAQKSAETAKPEYMKMSGSIFNAPGVKSNTKADGTLTDLNTRRSIDDLNNNIGTTSYASAGSNSSSNPENIANIDNASDGRAAANDAEASADNVRSLTADTQQDETTVNKFSEDATKLDTKITKDNKKFEKNLKAEEKELKKTNQELEKVLKESEEAQTEIDNAQSELESLLGSNSFSINGQDGGSSANSDRIKELQSIIGAKTSVVQQNGRVIYSLQRSSARTLKQMNVTNKAYVKTQNINKKNIEENQSTTDKVIKVATTIEQVSALVSQVGQAVNYAGQGLVALGSASFISGPAAAALISAGTVMQKVGKVADMVGQYGQAAANVTKTAAYAADGNLAGAFQSAAAAVQTGVAASKSTANLKKDFAAIDNAAKEATEKAAANQAAKDIVDQKLESGEDLGGLSEKQARKNISNDLQSKFNDEDNPLQLEQGVKRKDQIKNFGAQNKDAVEASFETGISKDYAMKNIGKKAAGKSSTNFWDNFQKWGSSLQNTAALFGSSGNQNYNQTTNSIPDFYFDQRTLDIMAKNQRRRSAYSGMYT